MTAATITLDGKRFVVVAEAEYERLRGNAPSAIALPPLPKRLPNGNYPAIDYARAVTARDIITARQRSGVSQAELARQAGIRVETLNRIERAKMTPSVAIMQRIDRALTRLESPGRPRANRKARGDV
jgi:DNA-binding XRE family transcriptional regulator